jgi:hypothetical protein
MDIMISKKYSEVRDKVQPGDLIAFGGMGWVSRLIKWRTNSKVSHVGVVSRIGAHGRVMVMESTSLDGKKGVQLNRLSSRVDQYKGHVWWFPLNDEAREKLDLMQFWKFLWAQDGKKYDYLQAPMSATLFWAREDFGRLFCSELVAGAYEAGGILPNINASEVTPEDLCRMRMYQKRHYHIKAYDGEYERAI